MRLDASLGSPMTQLEIDNIRANSESPTVLMVGTLGLPDFDPVVELLRATAQLQPVDDITAACALMESLGSTPDVALLAQPWPGATPFAAVERLIGLLSGAEIYALLGTWCEGETRTGRPWPGVGRLYWHEFRFWWRRFLRQRRLRREEVRTACDPDDKAGRDLITNRDDRRGVVIVDSERRETFEGIADCLIQVGLSSMWRPRNQHFPLVKNPWGGVWDGGQISAWEVSQLKAFHRSLGPQARACVALVDFPRRDRMELLGDLGVTEVLGKPWRDEDLWLGLEARETLKVGRNGHRFQANAA